MPHHQPCYQPLDSPIWNDDGQQRDITPDEAHNLLHLGVSLLAFTAANRHREADDIYRRLGFDHCTAAIAYANSCVRYHMPDPII